MSYWESELREAKEQRRKNLLKKRRAEWAKHRAEVRLEDLTDALEDQDREIELLKKNVESDKNPQNKEEQVWGR